MPTPTNAIMNLRPYRHNGLWVFDDENTGLVREPFVSGIDRMIDHYVAECPDAESGFTLIFSSNPFPGYQAELHRVREEFGGNWYHCVELGFEGWLCPALFKYYDNAPERLYAEFRA